MNKEIILCAAIAILVFWIVLKIPVQPIVRDRVPSLPIDLYTNGVKDGNTNNVVTRKNFRQQPYG